MRKIALYGILHICHGISHQPILTVDQAIGIDTFVWESLADTVNVM